MGYRALVHSAGAGGGWLAGYARNGPALRAASSHPLSPSVTIVGYGTDATRGPYWIIKNSWSTAFANDGFIYLARGISCGQVDCCGNVFTYGEGKRGAVAAASTPLGVTPLPPPHPPPLQVTPLPTTSERACKGGRPHWM